MGNIVIAVVPKKTHGIIARVAIVALVSSIWVSARKPKLTTHKVSLNHAVAVRILEMHLHEDGQVWRAMDVSTAFVVEPTTIVSILDSEKSIEEENGLAVKLSESSMALVQERHHFEASWPVSMDAVKSTDKLLGLYLARAKRGRKPAEGKTKAADGENGEKEKKSKKNKKGKGKHGKNAKGKGKHTFAAKLKKAKQIKETPFAAENLLKNLTGKALIEKFFQQLMEKEVAKYPTNPTFSQEDARCRLKLPKCQGVEWSRIKRAAFMHFKAECLGTV